MADRKLIEMSLAELAKRTGLPGRTIRFYIAKGLLPGPRKAGRDAAYGREHLDQLKAIRAQQEKGLTLAEIRGVLANETVEQDPAEPVAWWHYEVDQDIVITVRADASPWRLRQVRKFINEMGDALKRNGP